MWFPLSLLLSQQLLQDLQQEACRDLDRGPLPRESGISVFDANDAPKHHRLTYLENPGAHVEAAGTHPQTERSRAVARQVSFMVAQYETLGINKHEMYKSISGAVNTSCSCHPCCFNKTGIILHTNGDA